MRILDKLGLEFYGGADDLIQSEDTRVILFGSWCTGKTYAVVAKAHLMCMNYPNAFCALTHKHKQNIYVDCLALYKNIIKETNSENEIALHTDKKVVYKNGSTLYFSTIDSLLSCELDYIGLLDIKLIDEQLFDVLTSRILRGTGNTPYTQLAADYSFQFDTKFNRINDDDMWFWEKDNITFLKQNHFNNPVIFDMSTNDYTEHGNKIKYMYFEKGIWKRTIQESGRLTKQGEIAKAELQKLTGIDYDRYYLGKWV